MTDKELLELAAKAAGINGTWHEGSNMFWTGGMSWEPLHRDDHALRLAVKLCLSADFFDDCISVGYTPNDNECDQVSEPAGSDPYAATRRAIVRAAAEIGKGME